MEPGEHAYTLVVEQVEGKDRRSKPKTMYSWRCTCGKTGKPSDDESAPYDGWISHQQRAYATWEKGGGSDDGDS